MAVKADLPAQSETTALATTDTGNLLIVQALGEGHVRALLRRNVLRLEPDVTHPSLMADGSKNVTGGTIQDRRVAQLPEIDVARMWEPTGNTGIDTMVTAQKSHRGKEALRHNLSHHVSAV
jgi:hypothetical protein